MYLYPSKSETRPPTDGKSVVNAHRIMHRRNCCFFPPRCAPLERRHAPPPRAHARVTHVACEPGCRAGDALCEKLARSSLSPLSREEREERDERRNCWINVDVDVDKRTERKFDVRAAVFAGWARGFITPRSHPLAIHPFLPPPRHPPPQSEDAYCASP